MLKAVKPEKKLNLADPEAESVVVAAALKGITFDLNPSDFFDRDWARIYAYIQKAREAGEPVTVELIKRRLGFSEKLMALGPASPEDGEACAGIVKEKSALRKLHGSMKSLYGGGDVDVCLAQALDAIRAYRSAGNKSKFDRAGEILDESLRETEWGMLYGFPHLDAWTRGMHRGELILIAGRPSIGKTTFAVQIAARVSTTGVVAFFSLEMSARQIAKKAACSLTGLTAERLVWDGKAADKARNANLYISDRSVQTPEDVQNMSMSLKNTVGLDLVVVDYLQLLRTNKRHDSREHEVSEISRSLKLLAKDLDVPVIALSQLSRDVEKRGGRPKLSDLRGSGSLEQDADLVFFIHRGSQTEIILEKQRNGPTGVVEVDFHPEVSQFTEIGEAD